MASTNMDNNNNNDAVDSDNDTQMSTQDNNNNNSQNKNNNNNSNINDNPAVNIDNAANNTNNNDQNNDNDNDDQMADNTNNNDNSNNNNGQQPQQKQQQQQQSNDDDNKNNADGDGDTQVDDNTNNNDNNNNKNNDNQQNNNDDIKQGDPNNNKNQNNNAQSGQQQQPQQPQQPQGPQYKFEWQWLENDGTWKPYDPTTQKLLNQLQIGNKITISAGKWTYDITKTSNDACQQTNTQTQKTRTSRRARVLIVPPSATQNNNNNNNNNNNGNAVNNANNNNNNSTSTATATATASATGQWIGTGRYVFGWQFLENDNKWKDLKNPIASTLEALPVNGTCKYSFGQYSYTVNKITADECTQTNDSTNNQRDLRRILYDTHLNKRPVWQFNDDKGGWTAIDSNNTMLQLINLPVNGTMNTSRGQWNYVITKTDATHATQKNTSTQKTRQYRMVNKDKDEMDPNWSSKASTNNQNYSAGYNSAASQQLHQQYAGGMMGFGGLFASLAARAQQDDDKPKEIIKLDPNDVQDVVMGDLAALNANDLQQNEDNMNSNSANKKKSPKRKGSGRLRGLFGKKKSNDNGDGDGNGNDGDDEEEMNGGDNDEDDDDTKEDVGSKSERVLMGDDDRQIYNEFQKTLNKDTVQVISIQRIKENASKKIVYDALLNAKKDELKDKNVDKIERILFHGTSFANIAKIVNNGFNRDFNRHHLYGKGTYFSSLASESAKYCENDAEEDDEKYVMLVCRVIIGEFTKGSHDMDGSSIPYKPDKKTQYESCVNHVKNPTIFVINRDYHAIPTHIITFKYLK